MTQMITVIKCTSSPVTVNAKTMVIVDIYEVFKLIEGFIRCVKEISVQHKILLSLCTYLPRTHFNKYYFRISHFLQYS